MAPKLFLTGATGFVGGDALYALSHAHPDWEWSCLVRTPEKGAKVAAAYPQARLVYGTLDDVDLIEDEASNADIVIHAAASDENVPSAQAIVRGLARRRRQADGSPGYYIHTSGALSLGTESINTGRYGDRFDKVHDDWDNYDELINLPESVPHGKVDKLVMAAASENTKVALLAPPAIYGEGRGPDKASSVPVFAAFRRYNKVFGVGKGENVWSNVHVQDLSSLFLLLVESAVNGGLPAEGWNEGGYYLAENGFYVVKEMLQLQARLAHEKGLLPTAEVDFLTAEEADKIMSLGAIVFGVNVRCTAIRAKKLLGWKPVMPSFEEELVKRFDVAMEVRRDHDAVEN